MVGHDRPRTCPVTGARHGSTTTQRQGGVGYSGTLGRRGVLAVCADCGTSLAYGWGAATNDGRVVAYTDTTDEWRGFYRLKADTHHGESVLIKVYARTEDEARGMATEWHRQNEKTARVYRATERARIARKVG